MATAVQPKIGSNNPTDLKTIFQETHNEALMQNDFATRCWLKMRDEHLSLRSHLGVLPDKLSQEVMVPVGSKALMRGKMVHTNEILVCLGDGWFVKRSAKEASEICDRRIKLCENMLKDLEREKDLLTNRKQIPLEEDAFGAGDRNEILETYDEEKETQWRIEHQKREKEHRKNLSELRNKDQSVSYDENLLKRLDELELQEELEDELDRLYAEHVAMGREDGEIDHEIQAEESERVEVNEDGPNGLIKIMNPVTEPPHQSSNSERQKRSIRRVSFADERTPNKESDSDSDASAETLKIEFHHSPVEIEREESRESDEHRIQSPADISNYIKDIISKGGIPKSILKNKLDVELHGEVGSQRMKWLEQPDSVPIINQEIEEPLTNYIEQQPLGEEMVERPVVIGDVLEHGPGEELQKPESSESSVRTSKFKAMRLVTKR